MTDTAVRVVNVYRRNIHTVTVLASRQAAQAWLRSGGDRDRWLFAAAAVSVAARRATASATIAMHGLLLGAPPEIALDEVIEAPRDSWSAPAEKFEEDRSKGMLVAAALAAGALRAASAAATDVTTAARSTAVLIDESEPRITGYARTLSHRACSWCAEVAGQDYRSAASASAVHHDNCRCNVIPIIGELNPARTINAPLRDLPDSAYVTDDGEPADRPDA